MSAPPVVGDATAERRATRRSSPAYENRMDMIPTSIERTPKSAPLETNTNRSNLNTNQPATKAIRAETLAMAAQPRNFQYSAGNTGGECFHIPSQTNKTILAIPAEPKPRLSIPVRCPDRLGFQI